MPLETGLDAGSDQSSSRRWAPRHSQRDHLEEPRFRAGEIAGEKRADPTRLSHLALCLQSADGGDTPPPDHDCGACNLAGAGGLPARGSLLPFAIGRIARIAVERTPQAIPSPVVHLPGSRAPPAVA